MASQEGGSPSPSSPKRDNHETNPLTTEAPSEEPRSIAEEERPSQSERRKGNGEERKEEEPSTAGPSDPKPEERDNEPLKADSRTEEARGTGETGTPSSGVHSDDGDSKGKGKASKPPTTESTTPANDNGHKSDPEAPQSTTEHPSKPRQSWSSAIYDSLPSIPGMTLPRRRDPQAPAPQAESSSSSSMLSWFGGLRRKPSSLAASTAGGAGGHGGEGAGLTPTSSASASLRSIASASTSTARRKSLELDDIFADMPDLSGDEDDHRDDCPFSTKAECSGREYDVVDDDFEEEFEGIEEPGDEDEREQAILKWKSKRKHYLILSNAGKPIYTRHGSNSLIADTMGIAQTIIAHFRASSDNIYSFRHGGTKYVFHHRDPLFLISISKLTAESEEQIRAQLEALYMQILSTLTLPALERLFTVKPSTDLGRPLEGTEVLLSSLADSFTRGSPSMMLSSLEALRMRKRDRGKITNALLRCRCDELLYGLVVAGGKLVSVIRPRKHSLHPGDMQLVFNMIFEADGVKAGGGDRWIPICLPGFNNTGYLYMFVGFADARDSGHEPSGADTEEDKENMIAIVLISNLKEAFFELQEMRDKLVKQLNQNGSIEILRQSIAAGRPDPTTIIPDTPITHVLYKSKRNVQFTTSSYAPHFTSVLARRKLLSTYHILHGSMHVKVNRPRVHQITTREGVALAWQTPEFEMYVVAPRGVSRRVVCQGATRVARWAEKERERLFIIGGGVF